MKNFTVVCIVSLLLFVLGSIGAYYFNGIQVPLYALLLVGSFAFFIFNLLVWKKII